MSSSEELARNLPAEDASDTTVAPERVGLLLNTLSKAIRAHQIYQSNNPVYQRFVASMRGGFADFWKEASTLELRVDEDAFDWQGNRFPVGEGRDSLPFLFYKDGVRYLTFLPGFEDEVGQFLEVVHRARQVDQFGDDLITLLWEGDFAFFQYGYVDQLAEGVAMPEASDGELGLIPAADVAAEVAEVEAEVAEAEATNAPPPPATSAISREDFEETLYFLDEAELLKIQDELEREWRRDVKSDVVNALFDRLEDPDPARQTEILGVVSQLIPILLARGDLGLASNVLLELTTLGDQRDVLGPDAIEAAEKILDELSRPEMLEQLLGSIEHGSIDPDAAELGIFLNYLRPEALPFLLRATEITTLPALRDRFTLAVEGIARENAPQVIELLDREDKTTAIGAARLAGRLKLADATPQLARLLERSDADVRLAAVDALVALRSSATVEALLRSLRDSSRDVRIAAARGIGAMRYAPARKPLEELLQDRQVKEADLTEKIAFFETYGSLAGPEGVQFLDKLLNGRSLIGGRQPTEIRACAARALGRINNPLAEKALRGAAEDKEPLVRSAVQGALRKEGVR